ncbi:MAG: hypothetical protein J6V25_07095 [Oscillospiraceae bacterium]|nr:hypothetical protein [Oscillospiraceae bacterium]
MSGIKKVLVILLCISILICVTAGFFWAVKHYVMVDWQLYPRDIQVLDLRGQEISLSHYKKLRRKLPQCTIYWDIPLQGKYYAQDTKTLTLPDLSQTDAEILAFFPELAELDVRGCTNYDLLQKVCKTYPKLRVLYTVTIGGTEYDQDTKTLCIQGLSEDDLSRIPYLSKLSHIYLESGENPAQLAVLIDYCRQQDIRVQLKLNGTAYDLNVRELTVEGITEKTLPLMQFLPELTKVTFTDPVISVELLQAFAADCPSVDVNWQITLFGITVPHDAVQIDLTAGISPEGAATYEKAKNAPVQGNRDEIVYLFPVDSQYPIPDMTTDTDRILEELERALPYLPNAQKIILCGAVLDNEAMAAFRDRHREDFKLVWTVQCGSKMYARTDTTYFMPTKYHVYYFLDSDAVNLKYCEDMICIDLGHMAISNIDWVAYMPNLEYLVLAHTQLKYIEPIRTCKKLKFLELDWSPIRDYTPLKDCTALEDLNLGETFADFTPVGQMTWLKNLWMVGCSNGNAYRMSQALPNTTIMAAGNATVANGWRKLPNYYAMRDALGMYYMVW